MSLTSEEMAEILLKPHPTARDLFALEANVHGCSAETVDDNGVETVVVYSGKRGIHFSVATATIDAATDYDAKIELFKIGMIELQTMALARI